MKRVEETATYDRESGAIAQIVVEFADKTYLTGTGYNIDDTHVLTAAHNIIKMAHDEVITRAKAVLVYLGKNGKEYVWRGAGTGAVIHPKYLSQSSITSGFDLAIVTIEPHEKVTVSSRIPRGVMGKYARLKVVGYPGRFKGNQYKAVGVKYGFDENIIWYKDIITERGQDGSPLYGISDKISEDSDIIGIHLGCFRGKGYAVRMTEDRWKWVDGEINNSRNL